MSIVTIMYQFTRYACQQYQLHWATFN